MLYYLIIFTLLSVNQGASSCYSKLPGDYIGLLESEGIELC